MDIRFKSIGSIRTGAGCEIQIDPEWRGGLSGLEGFSHLIILWHADQGGWDNAWLRIPKPYREAPAELGIFATRSPQRPNAICQTVVEVQQIIEATGKICCTYIDAMEGSPVLDIKPWLACCEQPMAPRSPGWCSHWPGTIELSGHFDWEREFLFDT